MSSTILMGFPKTKYCRKVLCLHTVCYRRIVPGSGPILGCCAASLGRLAGNRCHRDGAALRRAASRSDCPALSPLPRDPSVTSVFACAFVRFPVGRLRRSGGVQRFKACMAKLLAMLAASSFLKHSLNDASLTGSGLP